MLPAARDAVLAARCRSRCTKPLALHDLDSVGGASRKLVVPQIIDATRAPERREVR
jgi:hypothetical protein